MRQLRIAIVVLVFMVGCSRASEPPTPPVTATTTIGDPTAEPTATATPEPPTATPTATATSTPEPTSTPTATVTPEPTPTPQPSPTPSDATADQAFVSGGLGLAQAEWDAAHVVTGDDILGVVYDEHYVVSFRDGNVHYLERQWSEETAVAADEVVPEAEQFIPADSQFVEVYSPEGQPESTVRLYVSQSLAGRFGEGAWSGGEPGNFTIQFNEYEFGVTRLIIAVGNNPRGAWRSTN